MLDSGAVGNVMPFEICKKLNLPLTTSPKKVTQVDKIEVKVIEMLPNTQIQIAFEPRMQQHIDIQVIDIPDSYGILLSRDW